MSVRMGNYEVLPITVRSIVDPSKPRQKADGTYSKPKVGKDGKKPPSFPITVWYIYLRDTRSGLTWRYTGVRRNGELKFSDGRHEVCDLPYKSPRVTADQLTAELNRLLGGDNGALAVQMMFAREEKASEIDGLLDPWNEEIERQRQAVKNNRAVSANANGWGKPLIALPA